MGGLNPGLWTGLLFLAVVLSSTTAQSPCERTDPSLSTTDIVVSIDEAIESDLIFNGQLARFRDQLRVSGTLFSTVNMVLEQLNARIDPNQYFVLENTANEGITIRLIQELDRDVSTGRGQGWALGGLSPLPDDDLNSLNFVLRCTPVGTGATTTYNLRVNLNDVNDNSPVFIGAPYTTVVNELTPIGTTVFDKVAATDNDLGTFKEIYFTLVPAVRDDGSEHFAIERPLEGYVTVKKQLDYEQLAGLGQTFYIVNISASDRSVPESGRRVVYTTLTIEITDGDDLEPAFEYETCTRFNGVCYNPRFTTTITSGVLTQGELVIYPYPAFAPIQRTTTIRARDLDTLDSPIRFAIQETIPEGYEQAFSVFSEPPAAGSGSDLYRAQLFQNATINRSFTTTVRIFIRAIEETDQNRYERALVTATILPANDFNPIITSSINSFVGYIPENSPRGTLITDFSGTQFIRLQIVDSDVLSNDPDPFYTFTVQDTSLFTVTSDQFIALNSDVLDYESSPVIIFGVVVTEGSTAERRSSTSTFTVSVQDRNDFAPVFQSPSYAVSIPEGDYTFSNQQFLTVSATDADTGFNQVVTYSIDAVNNNGGSLFSISSGSGVLSAVGVLTRGSLYTVVVKASDSPTFGESRFSTAAVVVNVTKSINQGPSIPANVYNVFISEGVPLATSIFATPASDPEGDELTYSIISGNSQNDFLIGSSDGTVRNRARLDFETRPSYSLVIFVQDQSLRSATTTLSVTVTDINDNNPSFLNASYVFFVPENQAGYIVGSVEAIDRDDPGSFNAQVSYSYAPSTSSR
ncbi:cadherin-99C-like [Babylonia areolata]|uniref:cadherin-99C-like n=1 Tax=Babylonia areolata TaxID=304850 RepID=UPI003FD5CC9F